MTASHGGAASFPTARALAYACAAPLPASAVPIHSVAGRVLAEPLHALASLPPFDASAMDGWAVRGEGPWRAVGRVLAGESHLLSLPVGHAVEVATGAAVPRDADGVIPHELATATGDRVSGRLTPGRHIRRAGEECAEGSELLARGTLLSAACVGLAAAVGHDVVRVHELPRVHALVTGNELLLSGRPHATRIRDAIGPMLDGAVHHYGGQLTCLEHLPDDALQLMKALDAADAEVVVTTGASSVGPADFLPRALTALGAEILVDGVRVRPGHPQVLARLPSGVLVIGLPGNPLAALAALVTLLAPALARLGGRLAPETRHGTLTQSLQAAAEDHRLVPVTCAATTVTPCGHSGSAMLRGAAAADALAVVPPGPPLDPGAQVELLHLP